MYLGFFSFQMIIIETNLSFSIYDPSIKVIGGSKVSTKLPVIKGLLNQVDTLILGGGLAFTFIKGLGVPVGNSLVEDSMIETSQDLMTYAKQHNKKIVLPLDAVCGTSFPSKPVPIEETKTFDLVEGSDGIDDEWSGFDVGPKSISWFKKHISGAAKVVFNGRWKVISIQANFLYVLSADLLTFSMKLFVLRPHGCF